MNTNIRIENRKRINNYQVQDLEGKVDFYPAYIQIEQTSRCNAECIMCNHFYLGNRGCNDIDLSVIEKIEPILPYCETIMLNGDGEPFLCHSIEQNIRCFRKYGVKIGTNTNLSFVPDEIWPFFSDTFEFLNISCDGATRETFEMIRQGLKWKTFLGNLARLNSIAPLLKKNFDCVVSKQNVQELSDIVKLAVEYGVRSVRFRRLGVNPCIGNETDQVEYYHSILMDSLTAAQCIGKSLGVEVSYPNYKAASQQFILPSREEMTDELIKRKKKSVNAMKNASLEDDYCSEAVTTRDWNKDIWFSGKKCKWAIERCYIDIRGNVTTCCFNMKKHMGSLKNLSFDEIWNGAEYVEFRKLMAKHLLPDFCKNCNWIKDEKF